MENNKNQKKVVEQVLENTVESLKKSDNVTLTILTGNAPEPLKQYNDNPVTIEGTICAPRRFCEVRDFDRKESHCLVST